MGGKDGEVVGPKGNVNLHNIGTKNAPEKGKNMIDHANWYQKEN